MKAENVFDWQPENAQSSQNHRTAKKRPDIRNNSHWGIGSDKIMARCTRESSIEGKRNPPQSWAEARVPSRSTSNDAEHMGGHRQIDQKPSSRTFPDLVCLFSSGACSCRCCDNVSIFSYFFREDLPCCFNYWVHFSFRYRWRFSWSKKERCFLPGKTVQLTEMQSIAMRLATRHMGPN